MNNIALYFILTFTKAIISTITTIIRYILINTMLKHSTVIGG